MTSDFIYLECRIGTALGLSDSMVKSARRRFLKKDADYRMIDGRIAYSPSAVDKLISGLLSCDKSSASTKDKVKAVDVQALLSEALTEPVLKEKQATAEASPTLLLAEPYTVPDAVLVITRIFPRNRNILHARLSDEWIKKHGHAYYHRIGIDPRHSTHRIRVTSTRKFTVGMEVPCRWKQADLWVCTCRMPRRKGRWN